MVYNANSRVIFNVLMVMVRYLISIYKINENNYEMCIYRWFIQVNYVRVDGKIIETKKNAIGSRIYCLCLVRSRVWLSCYTVWFSFLVFLRTIPKSKAIKLLIFLLKQDLNNMQCMKTIFFSFHKVEGIN